SRTRPSPGSTWPASCARMARSISPTGPSRPPSRPSRPTRKSSGIGRSTSSSKEERTRPGPCTAKSPTATGNPASRPCEIKLGACCRIEPVHIKRRERRERGGNAEKPPRRTLLLCALWGYPLLALVVVHHSLDSVIEDEHVEVDQQSGAQVQETKVRQELRFVNRVECFLRFDFCDDLLLDHKVRPVAAFQVYLLIDNRNGFLTIDAQTHFCQFVRHAGFVSRLQEAGAENFVDFHRGPDDCTRQIVERH